MENITSNFTANPMLNETLNITANMTINASIVKIKLSRGNIRLGQPVKWTKNVSLDFSGNVTVELPREAENVSVRKVDNAGEAEANAIISGNVVLNTGNGQGGIFGWLRNLFNRITGRVVDNINSVKPESVNITASFDNKAERQLVKSYKSILLDSSLFKIVFDELIPA